MAVLLCGCSETVCATTSFSLWFLMLKIFPCGTYIMLYQERNGSSAFAMHDFIKKEIVKEAAVEPLLYPAVLIVLWTYEGKVFLC